MITWIMMPLFVCLFLLYVCQVRQLCLALDAMLVCGQLEPPVLEAVFLEGLLCSLGATLLQHERERFDEFVKYLAGLPLVMDPKVHAGVGELPGQSSTLYDFHFDIEKSCWRSWSELVPRYVHDPSARFADILVPTVDTVRVSWLLDMFVRLKHSVLLVGDAGTSKTSTTRSFLKSLSQEAYVSGSRSP
uniref:Dynein heavy chain AAA 5 extension domain-containing protein n=1 Tax=Eptatretus burgeri TaxID=7764 RepID=A0A8C4PW53_EPTBU